MHTVGEERQLIVKGVSESNPFFLNKYLRILEIKKLNPILIKMLVSRTIHDSSIFSNIL
jgi:hypothetical protein